MGVGAVGESIDNPGARMPYDPTDTICAIASPPGGGARGVVRLSGPVALDCLRGCFTPWNEPSGEALAQIGQLSLPALGRPLPVTLWLWPTSRSYTREPCAELHTIGSPPLLDAVVARLCERGARLAAPGEFTLRAFLAGRLDLSQAEAVLGVIEARTPRQLEQSLSQLAGGLGRPLADVRSELLDLLADLEAGLDFAEEDLTFVTREATQARIRAALRVVDDQLAQLVGRRSSDLLPRVALAGPPNAGKSSLFNALTGRAALVSAEAGTTRDYLEGLWEWEGGACLLIDTAGIEPTQESSDAQRLSRERRTEADLELFCLAADAEVAPFDASSTRVIVRTKSDLPTSELAPPAEATVSAWTGAGLRELSQLVAARLERSAACESRIGSAHCYEALTEARTALEQASALAASGADDALLALELRQTLDALGKVVGAVDPDDVLDRLFSRFCIGK